MSCATSIHSNDMTMVCVQHCKEQRLSPCRIMHCEKSDGTGEVTLCPVLLTSKYMSYGIRRYMLLVIHQGMTCMTHASHACVGMWLAHSEEAC